MIHRTIYIFSYLILNTCLYSFPLLAQAPPLQSIQQLNNGDKDFYINYQRAVLARMYEYLLKDPGVKLYPVKSLLLNYPVGITCHQVKQTHFSVLTVAFEQEWQSQSGKWESLSYQGSVIGERHNPTTNRKLMEIVSAQGFQAMDLAERHRPSTDRHKRVLYQYRVQFDPATCKN